MKRLTCLASAFLVSFAGVANAASGGLAISKTWTRDGQVIVSFDCGASLDWNVCAACPAAYSQTTNYSGMLATLLAHKPKAGMPPSIQRPVALRYRRWWTRASPMHGRSRFPWSQ
jgi:hypothetical protein